LPTSSERNRMNLEPRTTLLRGDRTRVDSVRRAR
jgi:hypothetical protein